MVLSNVHLMVLQELKAISDTVVLTVDLLVSRFIAEYR